MCQRMGRNPMSKKYETCSLSFYSVFFNVSNPLCRVNSHCIIIMIMMVSMLFFADMNECLSSPCVNSLSCSDLVDDYVCQCKPGWRGKNCDVGEIFVHCCSFTFFYDCALCRAALCRPAQTQVAKPRRNNSANYVFLWKPPRKNKLKKLEYLCDAWLSFI